MKKEAKARAICLLICTGLTLAFGLGTAFAGSLWSIVDFLLALITGFFGWAVLEYETPKPGGPTVL